MLKLIFKNTFFFTLIVALDQVSKYLIRIDGGFYICNKGISFGLLIPETLIYSLASILILFLIFLISKSNYNFLQIPLLFILSGATSNIIDRVCFGCVIDFINMPYWPVFNLADMFIVIGGIISVWQLLKSSLLNKSSLF